MPDAREVMSSIQYLDKAEIEGSQEISVEEMLNADIESESGEPEESEEEISQDSLQDAGMQSEEKEDTNQLPIMGDNPPDNLKYHQDDEGDDDQPGGGSLDGSSTSPKTGNSAISSSSTQQSGSGNSPSSNKQHGSKGSNNYNLNATKYYTDEEDMSYKPLLIVNNPNDKDSKSHDSDEGDNGNNGGNNCNNPISSNQHGNSTIGNNENSNTTKHYNYKIGIGTEPIDLSGLNGLHDLPWGSTFHAS